MKGPYEKGHHKLTLSLTHSLFPPIQKEGFQILKISKRGEYEKNWGGETKRGGKIFKKKGGNLTSHVEFRSRK